MSSVAAIRKAVTHSTDPRAISGFVRARGFAFALLVACAYYGGTKLGFLFTPPGRAISTLWPPNALLFSALLLTRVRTWPMLLVAVLPAHMLVQLHSGIPPLTAFGWYITNTAEAVLGAACLRACCVRHHLATHKLFETFRGVVSFVLLGVLLAPLVTSFLDAGVVVGTGWELDFWRLWRDRSLSNILANLTLIPPIVLIGSQWRLMRAQKHRYLEAGLLAAALLLIVGVVFGTHDMGFSVPVLIYLLLPCLLWAAVRFGSGGASASLLLIAVLSIWNAMHYRGPFRPHFNGVLSLQIFLTVIDVPLLCLGAVLAERRTVEDRLRQDQDLIKLVSDIASSFVSIEWDRIDDQITRSLVRLRDFLEVDRASIFELTAHDDKLHLACTTSPEGIEETCSDRTRICQADWVLKEVHLGHDILIRSQSELPADAAERKALADRGIQSIAIAPLGTPGAVAGILSVVSRTEREDWPSELIAQLHVLGNIFYNAMQRKKAFQALAESEQRFRRATDHSPMLVWMSDATGLCTYFNRSWLEFTGVGLERQLGDGWTRLVHPDDIRECLSIYKTAFEARRKFTMEYRLRRSDDAYRWVLDIGVPRFDAMGVFLGFIGSAVDVTERKNAQPAAAGLPAKVIQAQEEERQRIARELHDDIGQRLTLLTLDLDRLQDVPDSSLQQSMLQLLKEAQSISDCVRNLSHNLHPARLDFLPLGIALRGLCREFAQRTSTEVRFTERNVPALLPPDVKTCLYRVAQEALQNIVKHSQADRAEVQLIGGSSSIGLRVNDDGVGFVINQQPAVTGVGLASMRERLTSLAGTLTVTAAPSQGTRIEASVPLHQSATDLSECA